MFPPYRNFIVLEYKALALSGDPHPIKEGACGYQTGVL
jgi:hypothetical protein